jgi:hypothetical protein
MSSRFKKRERQNGRGGDTHVLPDDPFLTGTFPVLWEYLTTARFEDGSHRETSTLLVMVEQGRVKACLNDRDAGRSLWASADGLETALRHLEAALGDEGADWRYYKRGDRAGGKRG